MNPTILDRFSRRLARRLSRRATVRLGAGGTAAALGALVPPRARAAPPGSGQATTTDTSYFVQIADAGALEPRPAAKKAWAGDALSPVLQGAYLLSLRGHTGETIVFADRPQRRFGQMSTPQLLHQANMFPAANPPNAALTIGTAPADQVLLLELYDPRYDAATQTLSYGADLLHDYDYTAAASGLVLLTDKATAPPTSFSFGKASLFLDGCPDVTRCVRDDSAFPIPGGPYGSRWQWEDLGCHPDQTDRAALDRLCNEAAPTLCQGQCHAE